PVRPSGLPAFQRCVLDPQRQAAPPPQARLVGRPVPHLERHLRDVVTAIGVMFVRHRGARTREGRASYHPWTRPSAPTPLITNYAMLEHLLLLPRNAPLFANARLQSLVLDELHTYAGAQAIEVAFLIRKLKNHLGIAQGELRCVGTSASLAQDQRSEQMLLQFASDLFGEEFRHVVRGRRIRHPALTAPADEWSLSPDRWVHLGRALSAETRPGDLDIHGWNAMCAGAGIAGLDVATDSGPLGAALVRRFGTNREVRTLAKMLDAKVRRFEAVADDIFGSTVGNGNTSADALAGVVAVGLLCRTDASTYPLLPARYHVAASGIEGACVKLDCEL